MSEKIETPNFKNPSLLHVITVGALGALCTLDTLPRGCSCCPYLIGVEVSSECCCYRGMELTMSKIKRQHSSLAVISLWMILLLLLLFPLQIHAGSSSKNPFTLPSTALPKRQQQQAQQQQQQQHVLIYETEVLEDSTWKGAKPSRWTRQSSGEESPSPIHVQAPAQYQWQGDWKIIMSQTTDELGWQYIGTTRRRRTWLRSIIREEEKETTTVSTFVTKRASLLYSVLECIKEDWNFKGFGLSLYKSLLFLESFGFALRIPLSQNLDWCERHPLFPSISSSVGVYYPPTVALFFSVGANVDYMKWSIQRMLQHLKIYTRKLLVKLLRILVSIASLPLLMLNHHQVSSTESRVQHWISSIPISSHPQQQIPSRLNVDISERVGMSVSWRISRHRGYEFRVSYWHSYLPTILYLHSLLRLFDKLPMEYWLRRQSGSLGISTSGPTPSPPHVSCSACLSLSGFHYSCLKKWKQSSKMVEDSSNDVDLQSGKEQLETKIKSTASTDEQVTPTKRDEIEENAEEASGVKVAR